MKPLFALLISLKTHAEYDKVDAAIIDRFKAKKEY
jgi:hypothetical protein